MHFYFVIFNKKTTSFPIVCIKFLIFACKEKVHAKLEK